MVSRSLASLCGAIVALFALTLACSTATAQTAVVTRNVNLRTGPSSTQAIIRQLTPPDELVVLDRAQRNGYYEVRTAGGDHGWVYARYVRVTADTAPPAPMAAADGPPEIYRSCPMEGSAVATHRKESNRKKNRNTLPDSADIDGNVTLSAVLQDGADENRWSDARAASIVAFVVDVKKGGEETVNCGERDVRYRDTHIDVVLDPNDQRKMVRMIVEVTPRWRAFRSDQGVNWTTPTLKQTLQGRWVRFTGWLFWDFEHADEAVHTGSSNANLWRATAWEIHPVTDIKICPGTPETCDEEAL